MARSRVLLACGAATLFAACTTTPPPPPPQATVSIARLYEQPAERAFLNAMRQYEDGQHERAETTFRRALSEGLADSHDVAMANKHLAFIACAYNRPVECETAFRAAFSADPGFRLTDAEVGHPIWGPVYKRVAAEDAARRAPGK
jgi:Tfp pilus assembly protein PilF